MRPRIRLTWRSSGELKSTLGSMIHCWKSLREGRLDGLGMWWERREHWQLPSCRVKLRRGGNHEEVKWGRVGWCKGTDKWARRDLERGRGPCGLEKACQSFYLNGLYSLWHSRQDKTFAYYLKLNMFMLSICPVTHEHALVTCSRAGIWLSYVTWTSTIL